MLLFRLAPRVAILGRRLLQKASCKENIKDDIRVNQDFHRSKDLGSGLLLTLVSKAKNSRQREKK